MPRILSGIQPTGVLHARCHFERSREISYSFAAVKARKLAAIFSLVFLALITISLQAHSQPPTETSSRHPSTAIRNFGIVVVAYKDLVGLLQRDAKKETADSKRTKNKSADIEAGIYNFGAEVSYGDLTGEGEEEAAVLVRYRCGFGSDVGDDLFLYGLRRGKPSLIAELGMGSLAEGGICNGRIYCPDCDILTSAKRRLIVTRYRPDKAHDCHSCYGLLETTDYELRGDKLVTVDIKTRPLSELDPADICYRKPYTAD